MKKMHCMWMMPLLFTSTVEAKWISYGQLQDWAETVPSYYEVQNPNIGYNPSADLVWGKGQHVGINKYKSLNAPVKIVENPNAQNLVIEWTAVKKIWPTKGEARVLPNVPAVASCMGARQNLATQYTYVAGVTIGGDVKQATKRENSQTRTTSGTTKPSLDLGFISIGADYTEQIAYASTHGSEIANGRNWSDVQQFSHSFGVDTAIQPGFVALPKIRTSKLIVEGAFHIRQMSLSPVLVDTPGAPVNWKGKFPIRGYGGWASEGKYYIGALVVPAPVLGLAPATWTPGARPMGLMEYKQNCYGDIQAALNAASGRSARFIAPVMRHPLCKSGFKRACE